MPCKYSERKGKKPKPVLGALALLLSAGCARKVDHRVGQRAKLVRAHLRVLEEQHLRQVMTDSLLLFEPCESLTASTQSQLVCD